MLKCRCPMILQCILRARNHVLSQKLPFGVRLAELSQKLEGRRRGEGGSEESHGFVCACHVQTRWCDTKPRWPRKKCSTMVRTKGLDVMRSSTNERSATDRAARKPRPPWATAVVASHQELSKRSSQSEAPAAERGSIKGGQQVVIKHAAVDAHVVHEFGKVGAPGEDHRHAVHSNSQVLPLMCSRVIFTYGESHPKNSRARAGTEVMQNF